MRSTKATGWVAGTIVLVLGILAATWFLLAAPRFEAAANTMLEAENARAQNDLLNLQLAKLRADYENLDAYRAEVAELQAQIPADAQLAEYTRTVQEIADATGVFVLEVTPGAGQVFTLPIQAAAQATAPADGVETGTVADVSEGGTTAEPAAPAEPTAPAAPAGPTVPEGMVAVPFSVRVVGTYDSTSAFLERLQTGTDRLLLVTHVDGARQQAQEATPSHPAVADGDVELAVTGFTFVLRDLTQPAPTDGEGETEPQPLPTGGDNPFAPLG